LGIYAIADIDGCMADPNKSSGGAATNSLECITENVSNLLSNPAISGIAAMVRWSYLNPSSPTNSNVGYYDWSILDDIFGAVQEWNTNHPAEQPKTIQLGVLPGFWTPPWVFSNMDPCDPMFATNPPDAALVVTNCGCATFLNSEGGANTNMLLPLPWNPYYQGVWRTFIHKVADRYGTNPLLVTVEVAGPTASSEEMILPNLNNDPSHFYQWNPLFALTLPTNYQNSDTAFIQAWEDAVDMYGEAFSNLTLAVTTGSGLPNFLMPNSTLPYTNYSVPPGFCPDCSGPYTDIEMDCAAETTVLAYFADPQHGGNNAKATQEDGLGANGIYLNPLGPRDLGSYGIKWLAESTSSGFARLPGTDSVVSRMLGGLQFNTGFSSHPQTEGCNQTNNCPTNISIISPEQAFYNVLQVYFDGTRVGGSYGVTNGGLPLNYLQVYAADVLYANTNGAGSSVVDGFDQTNTVTAQSEFDTARLQIFEIAEVVLNVQAIGMTLQLTWPATAIAFQLQVTSDPSNPDGWKPDPDTPTLLSDFYEVAITPSSAAAFYRLATP
jgi:hypothetical protein